MRKSRHERLLFGVLLAGLAVLTPFQAAAFRVVFDPQNFVKNTITSLQAIKMVTEQIKSYALDLQRYRIELEQIRRLDPKSLVLMAVDKELRDVMQVINDLKDIYGDVETAKSIIEGEMRRYSASRYKSFDDYMVAETLRMEREGKGRMSAFHLERQAIVKAQGQLEQVQRMAEQIKAPAGIQQSLQTVNQHLNLMAAQNAQLMQLIAARQAVESEHAAMEIAKRQAELEEEKKIRQAIETSSRQYRQWLE